ncbi:DMT family transporter [Numidum massiliense]|uniref:DMT family transporter n=1 Tax=Numidum massiliense TaxID=1522315 RepID=UPI0006D5377C|nr:DMT family transporter [Numidum massiliense]
MPPSVVAALILAITVIWGFAWVLMKVSLQYMGPFTFSALRFGVGSATLFAVLGWHNKKALCPRKIDIARFLLLGTLQTGIVFALVMYSMRFVAAGKSSVLLYSMPLWSIIFAAKFLREKVTRPQVYGVCLGSLGLVLLIGFDIVLVQSARIIFGEALLVLAAMSWGLANVYYKRAFPQTDPLQVCAYQMLFGAAGIALVAVVTEWGRPLTWTGTSLFALLFTGVLASAFCYAVWFFILTVVNTAQATIATLLVPIFGLLFSWLMLDEALTLQMLLGSACILGGIVVSQLPPLRN